MLPPFGKDKKKKLRLHIFANSLCVLICKNNQHQDIKTKTCNASKYVCTYSSFSSDQFSIKIFQDGLGLSRGSTDHGLQIFVAEVHATRGLPLVPHGVVSVLTVLMTLWTSAAHHACPSEKSTTSVSPKRLLHISFS